MPKGVAIGDDVTLSLRAKYTGSQAIGFGCAGAGGYLEVAVAAQSDWTDIVVTDTYDSNQQASGGNCVAQLRRECGPHFEASLGPCQDSGALDGELSVSNIQISFGGGHCLPPSPP
eukprot:1412409-Prymnesium_polylepis.1